MKKIIETTDVSGMKSLLGERITVFCCRYIYSGKLVSVSDDSIELEDCGIVYETGDLKTKEWKDYQKLPNNWHISLQSIESFGVLK